MIEYHRFDRGDKIIYNGREGQVIDVKYKEFADGENRLANEVLFDDGDKEWILDRNDNLIRK